MNPIIEYYTLIITKKIVVSRKIRLTYKFVVENMMKNKKYEYREDLANHAINFIENFCRHSKGKTGGKPFLLELWQKAMICCIFGFVHKGTTIRKHRLALFMVARKNGKSTLASAISLYLLLADSEAGPEIYAVATKHDQAKIIWSEAVKMIKKSPYLRELAKPRVGDIITEFNEGSYRPLGRDSKSLDGLNVHGAMMDEVEAWTDMNMFDVIVDGTSARTNWLIFLTTTAGTIREGVYDRVYQDAKEQIDEYLNGEELDPTTIYFVYELDERNEWKDESNWQKANPTLGTVKDYEALARKVENAKRKSELVRNLLTKDFNIPETSSEAWLSLEDIQNKTTYTLALHNEGVGIKARYGVGGFDLSETTDLTCATVLFMQRDDETIYMKQMYWIPEDLLEKRMTEDKVPYRKWMEKGYMRTCQGNKINHKDVLKWFVETQREDDIYFFKIGYDGWSANYLVDDMTSVFGKNTMDEVRQGVKTLSSPMYQFGADLRSKKILYNANPVFEWCCSNVRIAPDTNGNIKPVKLRNTRIRIDGFASALDAYVSLDRYREDYLNMI